MYVERILQIENVFVVYNTDRYGYIRFFFSIIITDDVYELV